MKLLKSKFFCQRKFYSISNKFLSFLPKFKKNVDKENQKPNNEQVPYTNVKIQEIKLLKSKKVIEYH